MSRLAERTVSPPKARSMSFMTPSSRKTVGAPLSPYRSPGSGGDSPTQRSVDSPVVSDDDERSYVSTKSAASVASKQSERSHRSTGSGKSTNSMVFKERMDKKALKPDFSYSYKVKGSEPSSQWSATFDKSLEEFIYPSLQLTSAATGSSPIQVRKKSESEAVADNINPDEEHELHYPKWKFTKTSEMQQCSGEKVAGFDDDMKRGEKFIRESLQRNYRKRLKQESDAEKKKSQNQNQTVIQKKQKKILSATNSLENTLGLIVGQKDAFFLPKPADEVYKSLIVNSRTKVNAASLFRRAVNKINNLSVAERIHSSIAPQMYEETDESSKHLVDGILLYQIRNKLKTDEIETRRRQSLNEMGKPKITRAKTLTKVQLRRKNSTLNANDSNHPDTSNPVAREPDNLTDSGSALAELARVHRAIDSRNIGYEYSEMHNISDDEILDNSADVIGNNINSSKLSIVTAMGGNHSRVEETRVVSPKIVTSENRTILSPGGKTSVVHLPVVATHPADSSNQSRKMRAKDVLLMNELKSGLIPEQLLKRVPNTLNLVVLNLMHFGLGDELGKCLGGCLSNLSMLEAIGLCDNRLTGKSVSVIVDNLNLENLKEIDLSENDVSGRGAEALARLFSKKNCVEVLELSDCKLNLRDFRNICSALKSKTSILKELCVSKNLLTSGSAKDLGDALLIPKCSIKRVDLSWNNLDATGASYLAAALRENKSLLFLDLSSNSIRDPGGQELAACLPFNRTLQELNLMLNNIGGKACFVFSKTLYKHPSMKTLVLSMNPLGEPGARALFRMILSGMSCYVHMRNCSFPEDPSAFNHSNPALASPYLLDLSEPYQNAVFSELLHIFKEGKNCKIDSISHRPVSGGKETSFSLTIKDGEIVTKSNNYYWDPPSTGVMKINISYDIKIPTIEDKISDDAFMVTTKMICAAKSDTDRKNWLWLLCMDLHFTTHQAQQLINSLQHENLIEPGGITKVDVVRSVWENIVDTENKYEFMCFNLDEEERVALGYALSFERLKFNYINPTGHWRLDMANRVQRNVMQQLLALNVIESSASKESKRGDTSQKGNWGNFRNERYNRSQEVLIDNEFFAGIGQSGVLEFDYVSTTRPPSHDVPTITNLQLEDLLRKLGLSPRRRLPNSKVVFKLLELQIAVTKYYFTSSNVITIMDCFSQDDSTQAKVVIALFSRVKDIENFYVILRCIRGAATQMVSETLGLLNIMNPLMPAQDYKISMKYMDNRIFVHSLCTLASNESGDMLKEYARTEILIIDLFATMGRIIQESQDKTIVFGYCELGERTCAPSWNLRRDLVKLFLIGSYPIDIQSVYKPIALYKELEEAKALSHGPIDLQYREYLKNKDNHSRKKNLATIN